MSMRRCWGHLFKNTRIDIRLYELPSIFIDGNSEQIFYVNCQNLCETSNQTFLLDSTTKDDILGLE